MIKTILIDDEIPALKELSFILQTKKYFEIIGEFTDPTIGLEQIKKQKPDVVFLDIEMPEINGLVLAQEILKLYKDIMVVFVTAFDEYAVKAFELNAIDYVLKPFFEKRIDLTVKRIVKVVDKKSYVNKDNEKLKSVINKTMVKYKIPKIPLWKGERIVLVDICSILYCTASEGRVVIITEKDKYMTQDTVNELEEKLKGQNFFRCHRSYLVNLNKVKEIVPWFNNTYILKLTAIKDEIPVSRGHIKEFKKLFNM